MWTRIIMSTGRNLKRSLIFKLFNVKKTSSVDIFKILLLFVNKLPEKRSYSKVSQPRHKTIEVEHREKWTSIVPQKLKLTTKMSFHHDQRSVCVSVCMRVCVVPNLLVRRWVCSLEQESRAGPNPKTARRTLPGPDVSWRPLAGTLCMSTTLWCFFELILSTHHCPLDSFHSLVRCFAETDSPTLLGYWAMTVTRYSVPDLSSRAVKLLLLAVTVSCRAKGIFKNAPCWNRF